MPGFNARGPLGEGPRTGRGLGNCSPRAGRSNAVPFSETSYGVGRGGIPYGGGRGRCFGGRGGFGIRRGIGRRGYYPFSADEEKEYLRGRIEELQSEIDAANKRISELGESE